MRNYAADYSRSASIELAGVVSRVLWKIDDAASGRIVCSSPGHALERSGTPESIAARRSSRLASPAKEVQATPKKLARVHPVSKGFHPLLVLLGGDRTPLERHRGRPLTHLRIEAARMLLEG